MDFTKEEIKAANKILQKHVPNRYPLFNNWVNAMQEYAKWYHEKQVNSVDLADVVGKSEQLVCDHPEDRRTWMRSGKASYCNKCNELIKAN
jgi:hypothetical protein